MKAVIRQLVEALDASENCKPVQVRFDGQSVTFDLRGESATTEASANAEAREVANAFDLISQLRAG